MGITDVLSLIGSVLLIIIVLFLTYYASRWYAKRMGGGTGKYIRIIDRAHLTQGSSVFIAKVGGKYFLIGSADKNVSLLGELEHFSEDKQELKIAEIPFSQVMREVLDKAKSSWTKKDDDK